MMDILKNEVPKYGLHDISLLDDNGILACAEDFSKIGNLKIVKR